MKLFDTPAARLVRDIVIVVVCLIGLRAVFELAMNQTSLFAAAMVVIAAAAASLIWVMILVYLNRLDQNQILTCLLAQPPVLLLALLSTRAEGVVQVMTVNFLQAMGVVTIIYSLDRRRASRSLDQPAEA